MASHFDVKSEDVRRAGQLVGATRTLDLAEPVVMGIVNATPDSFSDGGRYPDAAAAVAAALSMVDDGARIIDIGGESTRPGALPVTAAEEIERILPVIEGVRAQSGVFMSVDTSKPEVMAAACAAGADMVNDVYGLRAKGAVATVAAAGAAACVMHMRGEPRTMQDRPHYNDVVAEVKAFLDRRIACCLAAGIGRERLCLDPGFGFGKTLTHNLDLLRALDRFADDLPLVVGVSRKQMFARLFARDDLASRVNGSLAAAFWACLQGAAIIRTHDVRETCQVLMFAREMNDNRPDKWPLTRRG